MTDVLLTPWTASGLRAPSAAPPFDASRLATTTVPGTAGPWPAGDALSCPWSSVRLAVPATRAVRALPTLGPDLPVQRVPDEDVPVTV